MNTSGARIRVIPGKAFAPTEGAGTSQTQIQVEWQALTAATEDGTGSSPILSYQLMWDNGEGGDATLAVDDSLVLSKTIIGLTQGQDYLFKVRARNVYGYGEFSDLVTIRASSVPDTMGMINTVIVGTNIFINW